MYNFVSFISKNQMTNFSLNIFSTVYICSISFLLPSLNKEASLTLQLYPISTPQSPRWYFALTGYIWHSARDAKARIIQWVPTDALKAKVGLDDASVTEGLCEIDCKELKVGDIVQFERFGFARLDEIKDDGIKIIKMDDSEMVISSNRSCMYEIFDVQGRKVQSIVKNGPGVVHLDISSFNKGIYVIRINENKTIKFLKKWKV